MSAPISPRIPSSHVWSISNQTLERIARAQPQAGTLDAIETELADAIEAEWYPPRDVALVHQFIRDLLPAGRLFVTPAGEHTGAIIDALKARSDLDLLGIIDRGATQIGERFGLPVVTAAAAAIGDFDYVLLSHQQFEETLQRQLVEAGIPDDRIVPIYANPSYRDMSRTAFDTLALPADIDAVVIAFGHPRNALIADTALSHLLNPARTLRLFLGPPGFHAESAVFRTIDLKRSAQWLARALRQLKPQVVYFQTTFQTASPAWGTLIRRHAPEARLVVEFYDWMLSLKPDVTERLYYYSPEEAAAGLRGELVLAQRADAVIHKYGGPYWRPAERLIGGQLLQVFPDAGSGQIAAASAPATHLAEQCTFLYAGSLIATRDMQHIGQPSAILDALDALGSHPRSRVSLFNNYDRPGNPPSLFADLRARFAGTRVAYHAAIDYAELAARASAFHFGVMILNFDAEAPDYMEATCLSNKFLSYIWLGLPVIVAPEDVYPAMMVRRFGVGIVASRHEFASLPDRLAGLDYDRMRANVRRMQKFMTAWNERVTGKLRSLLENRVSSWADSINDSPIRSG